MFICQVSLARDIPIIIQNYFAFKNYYKDIKIFIICPKHEMDEFKNKLDYDDFIFICEDKIISFSKFFDIFETLSATISYREEMKVRLKWYYQQVLKISFIMDFVQKNKEKIIIWDADTIITKKIKFFSKDYSIKYSTTFALHKPYIDTNRSIFGKLPKYYISSLVQFVGFTLTEYKFFKNILYENINKYEEVSTGLTNIILQNIFKVHKFYNGAFFSEFELIGVSNYLTKSSKQKPIFYLRSGLDGQLSRYQFLIAKLFNVYHVTYEHSHLNKDSQGMLDRKQSWIKFLKIIFRGYLNYNLRNFKHNFYYYLNFRNHKVD